MGSRVGSRGAHPRAETGSPQVLSYLPGLLSNAEGTQVPEVGRPSLSLSCLLHSGKMEGA